MQPCSDRSHQILTIPNLLSAFRLVLAGVFAYLYWNAKEQQDYYLAVGVLVLSGLTDFADGKIARRFHMISELGKVSDCRVGVVADEDLKSSTEMFCYPFSNVTQSNFHLCTGNNVLPVYKTPGSISNLPGYLLRLPNNDDYFDVRDNRLHMEYRDLLEHLKDKDPSYYYSDVLLPNGKTLKDFIGG